MVTLPVTVVVVHGLVAPLLRPPMCHCVSAFITHIVYLGSTSPLGTSGSALPPVLGLKLILNQMMHGNVQKSNLVNRPT